MYLVFGSEKICGLYHVIDGAMFFSFRFSFFSLLISIRNVRTDSMLIFPKIKVLPRLAAARYGVEV